MFSKGRNEKGPDVSSMGFKFTMMAYRYGSCRRDGGDAELLKAALKAI